MDVGWVICWSWGTIARWILGLHYSNRCQQKEKVQEGLGRSDQDVITNPPECNECHNVLNRFTGRAADVLSYKAYACLVTRWYTYAPFCNAVLHVVDACWTTAVATYPYT